MKLVFKGTSGLEIENSSRRKEQSSLPKESKNAMMSRISPREEQSSSRAKKKYFETLYDERMTSLRSDGLCSGLDHPGLMRSLRILLPARDERRLRKRFPIRHQNRCQIG